LATGFEGCKETMRLVNELMERMVLDTDSPSRLRTARAYFAKWSSEWPHDAALQNVVAALDARLKRLGRKEPAAVFISNRARDIADEIDLPGNRLMLEFLSEAESLLNADGYNPEQTYGLMVQAAREYATSILQAGARRQIQ
jgi:hypothetical protein